MKHPWRLGVVMVTWLLAANVALADLRVWEQGRDEQTGEVQSPDAHRWVDVNALLQPLLALHFRADSLGGYATSPQIRRVRFGMKAQPWWWVRVALEFDVGREGFLLQDGYLDLRPHRAANVMAGRFRLGLNGPSRFHESDQAFVQRPVYAALLPIRRDGFRIHGDIGGDEGERSATFRYAVSLLATDSFSLVEGGGIKGVGMALGLQLHLFGLPNGHEQENDRARNTRPRVMLASSLYSNCSGRYGWVRGFGGDMEFRAYGIYLSGGYQWFRSGDADGRFGYRDCSPLGGLAGPGDQVHSGAHVQLQYVLPEVLFPVPRQSLEVLARLEFTSPESPYDSGRPVRGGNQDTPGYRVPTTTNDATRYGLTVGVTWYATPDGIVRVQLNYRHEFESEGVLWPETGLMHESIRNDVLYLQIQGRL